MGVRGRSPRQNFVQFDTLTKQKGVQTNVKTIQYLPTDIELERDGDF